MKQPVCFFCGQPARAVVSNIRPPMRAQRICMEKACWDAWYKLAGGGDKQ